MLLDRMMRAARLDTNLFEEVEHDLNATSQAATVVGIVALCSGLGGGIATAMTSNVGYAIVSFILGIVMAFVGWVAWSYITYWIGTSMFKGQATPGEILRAAGFAETPLIVGIFSFVPFVGGLLVIVGFVWFLIAGVIALRQALDISTGQAVITALIGIIPMLLLGCLNVSLLAVLAILTGAAQ